VVCAGCSAGTDVDKLLEPRSGKQKLLNDVEQHSSILQSIECSKSANCTSMFPEFEVDTEAAEGLLESSSMNGSCNGDFDVTAAGKLSYVDVGQITAAVQPAESVSELHSCVSDSLPEGKALASPRDEVCLAARNPVDLSVSAYSDAYKKTEDSLVTDQSRHSCSAAYTKQCWKSSDVRGLSQKCSSQSSIQSFFKPLSKAQQNVTSAHSMKNNRQSASLYSRDVLLHGNSAIPNSFDTNVDSCNSLQTDAKKAVIMESSHFTDKIRKCPFYKWIPGKISYSSCVRYCLEEGEY